MRSMGKTGISRWTNLELLRDPEDTADADEIPPVEDDGTLAVRVLLILHAFKDAVLISYLGLALGGDEACDDGTADVAGPVPVLYNSQYIAETSDKINGIMLIPRHHIG